MAFRAVLAACCSTHWKGMHGKTGSRCALRARADSHRGRRGCPVFQKPVLGAVDGERRNSLGVLGVLFEVPAASINAAGICFRPLADIRAASPVFAFGSQADTSC